MKLRMLEQLEEIEELTLNLKKFLYLYYLTRKKLYLELIKELQNKIDLIQEQVTRKES